MLSNAFAEISHDIVYKKPQLNGNIGNSRLHANNKRLCNIFKNYLMPAQIEFEKVKIDHQRVLQGKEIVDSGMLEKAKLGQVVDNNELHSFLEKYKVTMNDYDKDKIKYMADDVLQICQKTLVVSRTNKSPTIYNSWGNINGKTCEEISCLCFEILDAVRYAEPEKTINLLLKYSLDKNQKIRDKVRENLESVSEYNIFALEKVGFAIHQRIIKQLLDLSVEEKVKYYSAIATICSKLLSCATNATSSTYEEVTFHSGTIDASNITESIRGDAIKLLKEIYDLISQSSSSNKTDKNLTIISALKNACWQSSHANEDSKEYYKLINLILDNSKEIIKFYISKIGNKDYKLMNAMEGSIEHLYSRSIQMTEKEGVPPVTPKKNQELKKLIEQFREVVSKDSEFVIYRDLTNTQYGYRVCNSYWGYDENQKIDAATEQQKLVSKYVKSINTQSLTQWLGRIFFIAQNNQNKDLPTFINFLNEFARQNPKLALQTIIAKEKEIKKLNKANVSNIIISNLLSGAIFVEKQKAEELINKYIDQGRYLRECMSSLCESNGSINVELLQKALAKVQETIKSKKERSDILVACVRSVYFYVNFRKHELSEALKDFFLEVVTALTSLGSQCMDNIYYCISIALLVESLNNKEEIDIVLDHLRSVERINNNCEDILAKIAKQYPEEVIRFFEQRFEQKRQKRAGYDTLPYKFYNKDLKQKLAESLDLLMEVARKSFDDALFVYKGGALLQIVFDDFPATFEAKIRELIKTGQRDNLNFVLQILQSFTEFREFKDRNKLEDLCKEIIKSTLYDNEMRIAISIILTSSGGGFCGKYGLAELSEKRVEELKSWESDKNKNVREFYKKFAKDELDSAQRERQRTDEQEALRKFEYEN
jgi:hypothetical protein